MKYISIKALTKRFGEKTVFDSFSEELPANGVTVIMGESGCGKTTLINILMGFEKPDSGEITGIPDRISAVFQDDCLSEDFSALSNLKAVTGRKISKSVLVNYLAAVGLTGKDILRPVKELSGGMKRRVAITRALVADGELLIMDEPFKGLDSEMRREVMELVLDDTKSKRRGLVVITHDQNEAEMLGADKLIYFEKNN